MALLQEPLTVRAAACRPRCRCRPGTYREAEGGDGTECTPCQPGELRGCRSLWRMPSSSPCCSGGTSASPSNAAHHSADTRMPLPLVTLQATLLMVRARQTAPPALRAAFQRRRAPPPAPAGECGACGSSLGPNFAVAASYRTMNLRSNDHMPACQACKAGMPALPPPCSPRGTFSAVEGGQECNGCEPGSISNTTGATNCTACGAGRYTLASQGDTGPTVCVQCPRGTFKPANATDNKCQRWGRVEVQGQTVGESYKLSARHQLNSRGVACPHAADTLTLLCTPPSICSCPSGYATLTTLGASSCTACPAGHYSPVPNSISCTPCEPGRFTNSTGQKSCAQCGAGFVSALPAGLPAAPANGWLGNAKLTGGTLCVAW